MATKTSTDGKTTPIVRDGQTAYLLFDFDIDGAIVKSAHMSVLREKFAPQMNAGASVMIIGNASRTGAEGHNMFISTSRAKSVLSYLKQVSPNKSFAVSAFKGVGTQTATNQGQAPNTENPYYRSVYVSVGKKDDPPKDTIKGIPLPDGGQIDIIGPITDKEGMAGDSIGDILSMVNDVASGLGGIASFLFDVFGLTAVATVLDVFGMLQGVLGLASLPLTWAASDRCNWFNGYCKGFWQAMQDMVNGFQNPSLDTTPYEKWPPIIKPVSKFEPTPFDQQKLVSARVWTAGQREGCQAAWQSMVNLENTPKELNKGGKTYRLTGKVVLRALSKWKGGNVDDAIHAKIDERLRAKGLNPWPTF
jgi:hypothetical protein